MKPAKLILLTLLVLANCIRFKYDNLSPSLIAKIKLGDTFTTVESVNSNNVVTNIPLEIPVSSDYLFVADYLKSSVKLFDFSGNLEYVIGNLNYGPKKDLSFKTIKVKTGSIGQILPGADDDVFIESRIHDSSRNREIRESSPFESYSGEFKPPGNTGSSSHIIHLSLENESSVTIGSQGPDTEPFQSVEKLYLLTDNQLAVLHVADNRQILTVFRDNMPVYSLNETTIQSFINKEENLNAYIDTIIPHPSGKYSLFSYRYFDPKTSRFKFRRIFRYDHENGQTSLLKEIQDPVEILFAVKENNDFYLWETESRSGSIRLQLHDKSGYHYNNKRIVFPPPRAQWRETYTDAEDNLYSVRIRSGNLEVYKWN